jgi:homeobox protein cut-like
MHAELERTAEEASSELLQTKSEYVQQRELNEKLEQDLLKLHNVDKDRPGSPPWASKEDPLAALENAANGASNTNEGPIPFVSSAETSILPIVTSQRDRFRQRNAELEEVCDYSFSAVGF